MGSSDQRVQGDGQPSDGSSAFSYRRVGLQFTGSYMIGSTDYHVIHTCMLYICGKLANCNIHKIHQCYCSKSIVVIIYLEEDG